jgi:hypothetical protein
MYRDLAGRRHLRRYVIAAALILGFLGLVAGLAIWQRAQTLDLGVNQEQPQEEMPAMVFLTAERSTPTPGPQPGSCLSDPGDWILSGGVPGDNYQRIEPPCVYDGLAGAVAWHMLTRLGYTVQEAAGMLDFARAPHGGYVSSLYGLTATKGPMDIPLTVESYHPDLRHWMLDEAGNPAVSYSLRGCYRARSIEGNQVRAWDGGYAVVCAVAADYEAAWGGFGLDSHLYFSHQHGSGTRRGFLFFGYPAGGPWQLIGQQADLWVTIDPQKAVADRQRYAALHGAEVWDPAWLQAAYGYTAQALPESWQTHNDPTELQAIADILNEGIE